MSLLVFVPLRGRLPYLSMTRPYIEAYCRKYGYELKMCDIGDERHPSWMKMLVHHHFKADLILTMDADFMPLPSAPPIHEVLVLDKLNMRANPMPRRLICLLNRLDYPYPKMRWNCGLMGLPVSFSGMLDLVYTGADLTREVFWEQGEMNLYLHDKEHLVNTLDSRWNVMPKTDGLDLSTAYFIHLAGMPNSRRRAYAQRITAECPLPSEKWSTS